jgi:hypothetical protein
MNDDLTLPLPGIRSGTFLRLALVALERGDVSRAGNLLRAALVLHEPAGSVAPELPPGTSEFARVGTLARFLDASPRTVRRWIRSGRIPRDAIVGKGRGLRIDARRALSALRDRSEDAHDQGAAHVRRNAERRR